MQLNFYTSLEECIFPMDMMNIGYKAFLKGKKFVDLYSSHYT